jgi:hypothetical protein
VFYADEEYQFLGMKIFLEEYSLFRPKMLISADGSDLKIGHACRGLYTPSPQYVISVIPSFRLVLELVSFGDYLSVYFCVF